MTPLSELKLDLPEEDAGRRALESVSSLTQRGCVLLITPLLRRTSGDNVTASLGGG